MAISPSDQHHWAPIPQVADWLRAHLSRDARVLEIGPGHSPLPWATDYVDFVEVAGMAGKRFVKRDIATEQLPFNNKSFDFVYCRHTLEDMFNPFLIISQMSRVGKAGYIETPSPIAELCRGVDGGNAPYRGYHHHRFMAWTHGPELNFISKYPLVEHLKFDDEKLASALRQGPMFWNTYYLWRDKINYRHIQSPLDYDIPQQYGQVLSNAMAQSGAATEQFFAKMSKQAA